MVQRCTHILPVIIPNGIKCKYTWGPVRALEIQQWMDKNWWTSSLHFTDKTNRTWKASYRIAATCTCVLNHFSRVWLFMTLWTVACQAPLSMRFSRQEYWSGLPCPPAGDLPDPGIEPMSPNVSCTAGKCFTHWTTWVAQAIAYLCFIQAYWAVVPNSFPRTFCLTIACSLEGVQ